MHAEMLRAGHGSAVTWFSITRSAQSAQWACSPTPAACPSSQSRVTRYSLYASGQTDDAFLGKSAGSSTAPVSLQTPQSA